MPTTNQSSPALLQSVLSASQNAVMVYQAIPHADGQGTTLKLTMLNAVAERNLGRPATDVLGQSFGRLYPHLVGTGLDERYLAVIHTNQAARFEFQYERPGLQKPAWCDVSAVPLGENSVVVSYTDISQQKADADAVRLAHVLQQTFEASPSGITVLEAIHNEQGELVDFTFVMINEAGLAMSGYTRAQLLGRTLWEVYPATGINGLFADYVQVYETGQPLICEHYYPEYDTWRDIRAVRVPQGIMLTYTDITSLKKSEEAAHAQAQLVTDLLQNVPVGLALLKVIRSGLGNRPRSVDFQITRTNTLFEQILNPSARQFTGQLLTEVFSEARVSGLLSRCILSVDEGQSIEFELPVRVQTQLRWFKITVAPTGDQVMLTLTDITQLKGTQLEHHQQAELLNSVLNGSPNAILALQPIRQAGQIVDFALTLQNKIAQQLLGMPEEPHSHTLLERWPDLKKVGQFATFIKVVTIGQSARSELEVNFGPGTGWYELSAVKREEGLVLTVQDKTAQRRAEQQTNAQARLLASISDNTPAGLVLWEAVRDESPERNLLDFRYRLSNLMNTYVTGYPAERLIGQDLLKLFPRFRGSSLEAALRDTVETGQTQHMIFTDYTESAGGWFDAQFTRVSNLTSTDEPFTDARFTDSVLMTYIDVTQTHQAQLNQKQQADLLRLILDMQPSGIVLFEPVLAASADGQPGPIIDFVYKLVNKTQRTLTGRSNHELLGKRLRDLFPSDQGQVFFEQVRETAETGQPNEWLMPFYSDGIQGWFQVSLTRHNQDVLFTFLDVTDLKQQQQALEVVNHELQRSNENLQKFAYIASHDLQEPLRKIQSFGSLLATTYAPLLDVAGQDIIERMQKSAYRMSRLIKHLLTYSRLNTQPLQIKPLKVVDLINNALDELSLAVEESGAVVQWGDLPLLQGDPTQLGQLFQNLLSNAIKYRRPTVAPHIEVRWRMIAAAELPRSVALPTLGVASLKTGRRPTYHEISITDNGIGFDEKYLDRIFQVFQRLHGKGEYAGTGIGLAICQKVVENHQGAITATSSPGKGATFSVYLPRLDAV